ncbi:MAG: hypothetical protein QF415_02345 [Candidatus Undinarchaeales archaeon]|jgi:hypothetical protein|nr:hypothetical protein [Candidatus Undinarchaeales archaeon]MDP7492244.1 hypothetical protein [Candidatus Undinarchaeales archaeon]
MTSVLRHAFQTFIVSSLDPPDDVNGTEVIMEFEGSSEFYYPSGAVGSYKYKVPATKYIIRTLRDLAIEMNSSEIVGSVTYNDHRYHIIRLHSDIIGWIRQALFLDKLGDGLRLFYQAVFENARWVSTVGLFLALSLSFAGLMKVQGESTRHAAYMGLGVGVVGPILSLPLTILACSAIKRSISILAAGVGWLVCVIFLLSVI